MTDRVAPSRRRRTVEIVVAVAIACALAAVASVARSSGLRVGETVTGPVRIDAVLVSADGRTLTLAFTGARPWLGPGDACGAGYLGRAEARDGAVAVALDRVGPRYAIGGPADCPLDGTRQVTTVVLDAPLGARSLVRATDPSQVLVPFDGAKLVQPERLPPGFAVRLQGGDVDATHEAWWRTFATEPMDRPPEAGRPAPAWFTVEQYTPIENLRTAPGPTPAGTVTREVRIASGPATFIDGSSGPHLSWEAHGLTVRIHGRTYHGDGTTLESFTEAELIDIAGAFR